ncbi:MAG TPA: hypothetical protein VG367_07990 [Mucilaginibacter sp.]|nr:hypothetical protein [Mucilaginibacter sp.]
MRPILRNIYKSYRLWDYLAAVITLACISAVAGDIICVAEKLMAGQ